MHYRFWGLLDSCLAAIVDEVNFTLISIISFIDEHPHLQSLTDPLYCREKEAFGMFAHPDNLSVDLAHANSIKSANYRLAARLLYD
jgi:hypothetical protein